MEIVKVQQGQIIAKKNDKVKYWYLVQQGCVIQKFDLSEVKLEKNAIIGILEKDIYLCDYVAGEDVVLAAFVCENLEDLKKILAGQDKIRNIFLRSAILQRNNMLALYSELYNKTSRFHMLVEDMYNDYKLFCAKYRLEEEHFLRMEHFNSLIMQHVAETWEVDNSESIVKYLPEYLKLMEKDDSLTVGVIKEAAAQIRRITLGIGEMEAYLAYNKDILIGEAANDIYKLYFNLTIQMHDKKLDMAPVAEKMSRIAGFAEELGVYNARTLTRRVNEFQEYDYSSDATAAGGSKRIRKEIDITATDCLSHILEYAGYSDGEADNISKMIYEYRNLPDMFSTDSAVYGLRKKITALFYEIYYKVFLRAVNDEESLTPVLEMFLNFGFMDMSYVSEEHAKTIYELCAHLDVCRSNHIYTIYDWLKCIYNGEKESSKNEFDMDYQAFLVDLHKNGKLTKEQLKAAYSNREKRVEFEIHSMFASVNKLTYGKITTFCPILCENDLINSIEKMLVTAERLENALNEVRKIDYSAFYREVTFSDAAKGLSSERIMKEILPDIILMPNAGTKVMMWQETAGVKSDTPGRFMFPILTAVDLDELMLEAIGRFRWEMCRKMQGMRWNDVREKSLTAEYCAYIQFYRKNQDLSTEAKEKLKTTLLRVKNNYREVFVRDYINWIKYESKGSFRLNKVARGILVAHCPFVKSIRDTLKINPMYQADMARFEAEALRKLQRYTSIYNKYVKAGGEKSAELKENMLFYEM